MPSVRCPECKSTHTHIIREYYVVEWNQGCQPVNGKIYEGWKCDYCGNEFPLSSDFEIKRRYKEEKK